MTAVYLDTEFLIDHIEGAITFKAGTRTSLPADFARGLGNGVVTIHGPSTSTNAPALPVGPSFYDSAFYTANQVHRPGIRVLVCWASTGGRNNPSAGARNGTYQRYRVGSDTFVEIDVSNSLLDWYVGKQAKVISAQNPDIIALTEVTAIAAGTNAGDYHLTMKEYGTAFCATPRHEIALNTAPYKNDGTIDVHDMQLMQDAHSWMQKINVRLDGNLEYWNLSASGSAPVDWQSPDLRDYVQSLARTVGGFDFGFFNFGTGNAYTRPEFTASQIAAQMADNLAYYSTQVREGILFGEPGARLYGDDSLLASPQTTPDFTTLALNTQYDRKRTTEDSPTVVFVDMSYKGNLPSKRGATSFPDMLLGRTPVDYTDASGIHWTAAMNDLVAEEGAAVLIPRVRTNNPFTVVVPDNAYDNTSGDLGNNNFNQTLWGGWVGTVPTVSAAPIGAAGVVPQGMTLEAAGLTGNMSASFAIVNGLRSGQELQLRLLDPVDGGGTVRMKWRGFTARTILSMLNDARWAGKPLHLWWDLGVMGFNPHSVYTVDASLWGVHAVYGPIRLASVYTNTGNNGNFAARRNYSRGFNGTHRSCAPFKVPQPLTDAYMQLEIVGQSPQDEAVTIAGDGTNATLTCSIPMAGALGAIGEFKYLCQVSGASNAGFNLSGADGATIFTRVAETQVRYPCAIAGAAGGSPRFAQAYPMGELFARWGDMRVAADIIY